MNTQEALQLLKKHAPEIRACFGVKRLTLFGSVASGDADEQSDVDILGSYEDVPTFYGFLGLKFYLEEVLGPDVDLVPSPPHSPYEEVAVDDLVTVSALDPISLKLYLEELLGPEVDLFPSDLVRQRL